MIATSSNLFLLDLNYSHGDKERGILQRRIRGTGNVQWKCPQGKTNTILTQLLKTESQRPYYSWGLIPPCCKCSYSPKLPEARGATKNRAVLCSSLLCPGALALQLKEMKHFSTPKRKAELRDVQVSQPLNTSGSCQPTSEQDLHIAEPLRTTMPGFYMWANTHDSFRVQRTEQLNWRLTVAPQTIKIPFGWPRYFIFSVASI